MSWTPPAVQRQEALAKFISRLGLEYTEEQGPREIPGALMFAGHTIELEPWERALLQESVGGHSTQGQPWAPLLAEGIAFRMKCLSQLEPARPNDDGSPLLPVQLDLEELIVDAAVGLALLQETQRAIDQMVVAGEIAEAKKLTSFRNRIGQTVGRLKEEIGEDEFPRAENKAAGMVAPAEPRSALISRSIGPDPTGNSQTWNGRQTRASMAPCAPAALPADDRTTRLGPLTTLLIVLTAIWAIFILPKLGAPEPHILETAEFTDVPGIASTLAKPPSVYITVESDLWSELEGSDRKAMITKIGKVAEEQGYIGADIRNTEGVVIGNWLKARGASLVKP